jgi:hypothetical protein
LSARIGNVAHRPPRRADPVTREQIKWIALAGAVAAGLFALGLMLSGLLPQGVVYGAMMTGVLLLPVAAAIAILRYRLYDIDVVINRALVYGALTATLAGFYVGTVLLLQLLLRPFTAGSSLAIAVSTLAVAALFQPVRRRVQRMVDRRFDRARYDGQTTTAVFAARVRHEVDLVTLRDDLVATACDAVRPTGAGLWLRTRREA